MTILRDSVTQPEVNTDKAFSNITCNSRGTPRTRVNQMLHSNPNLWRGCDMAGQGFHGIGTGYHELDDILPGRGWPSSGLVEVIARHSGMGELQLLIPLMRSVIKQGKWILWVAPPYLLNAPALTQAGIDIDQILIVKQDTPCKDALWSMEKAMQTETCGLVLAWQNWLPGKVLRRLQLAAEVGDTLAGSSAKWAGAPPSGRNMSRSRACAMALAPTQAQRHIGGREELRGARRGHEEVRGESRREVARSSGR